MKRTDFRIEIDEAVKTLGIPAEDFKPANLYRYEDILVSIMDKFTTLGKLGLMKCWPWTDFKEPGFSFAPPEPLDHLEEIIAPISSPEETFWFIVEDEPGTKINDNFWLYEGKLKAIVTVLRESYDFEYYIVDKRLNWLLCETHHDVLIGVGEPIIQSLKTIKAATGSVSYTLIL